MRSLKTHRVVAGFVLTVLTLIAVTVIMVSTSGHYDLAQPSGHATRPAQPAAAISGLSRQPSEAARQVLLDPNDTVVLLLDHQTSLFQTVKDIPVQDLRNNTVVLAKIAEHVKAPIITTASEPNGPNGPLMPELAQVAPSAKYVARKGEISAWDNDDFVKAVEATGRKTLVIAGV